MTSSRDELEKLIADFASQREQLIEAQEEVRRATATVTSPRNVLTVTVGPGGEIEELVFNNRDYRRMGPEDLAALVRTTIADARSRVTARVTAAMGPLAGGDAALTDMMSGSFDWSTILPADLFGQAEGRPEGGRT